MNQEKIGKFIREKRKEKDLTQEELASILRVSNRTVSKWENGVCLPDYSIINELCSSLDISINEFLSGEELDDDSYQKKLEENMIKSITYKVRKNNRKMFFIIAIVLVLISLIGFGIKHVMFYYENETEEMIKQRQTDLSTRKIINEKITQNNLANQKVGDDFNGYNIYIPEVFKLENDISKLGLLGNSDCRVFFNNFRRDDEGYNTYDGLIRVCTRDRFYEETQIEEFDSYLDDKVDLNYYGNQKKYLEMKDVNIFSSKKDITMYSFLVNEFSRTCYDENDSSLVHCGNLETHLFEGERKLKDENSLKGYYEYVKEDNHQYVLLYGLYNRVDYYKKSKGYGKTLSSYKIEIFDKKNVLSEEEIKKIINSFAPITNEIDF